MVLTIRVETPAGSATEYAYVLGILFDEWLGLPWEWSQGHRHDVRITVQDQPGEITLPDKLLALADAHWLSTQMLPCAPFPTWNTRVLSTDIPLTDPVVPVLFGEGNQRPVHCGQCIALPIDILGSAFFMLSRYEEAGRPGPSLDSHDRFPATASVAYEAGFLERPIIDEYVEILWAAIERLWPQLQRQPRSRTLRVTCDVDSSYLVDCSALAMARGVVGDLLKRRSPRLAVRKLHTRVRASLGDFSGDPHLDTIDWMMDENERVGNRMAFYFMTARTHLTCDARYRVDERIIRKLLRRIHDRGHEIGLHPSYNTYLDPEQTQREADILRRTLDEEDIPHAELGGRQHFLRWRTAQTARNCEAAGMSYDSTLSHADRPGFRCGTSREFTFYDVEQRRPMKLKQRPLILMDCSVVAHHHMAMGYTDEALEYMRTLKERSLSIGGEFTMLWHNSYFPNPEARRFYRDLIQQ